MSEESDYSSEGGMALYGADDFNNESNTDAQGFSEGDQSTSGQEDLKV